MASYYELQSDIFAERGLELDMQLPRGVSFLNGAKITEALPVPLIYSTDHTAKEPPKGFHDLEFPVMSVEFVTALQHAGVENLQCFPAELVSHVDGSVWTHYLAVNIVGLISCADTSTSQYTHVVNRPGVSSVPLLAFEDLKLDVARTAGALLFRLAESPGTIVISRSVVKQLRAQKSDDEWGTTIDKIG